MKKVLVIGSGGREHALVWKLKQGNRVIAAPGNAGIAKMAECYNVNVDDIEGLANLAIKENVDLTVVGPEAPLVKGIVNSFEEKGLRIFGPNYLPAFYTEGSKVNAKRLMEKFKIPTAEFEVAYNPEQAKSYSKDFFKKYNSVVIKADGLAAGKGVRVCKSLEQAFNSIDEIMVQKKLGDAGNIVIIDEPLKGEEASFIAFSDGKTIKPLLSSQDHKPIFDNDKGENTGGMGAYAPAPIVKGLEDRIMREIMQRMVNGLAREHRHYKGVLYAGLMITKDGPKVLEFNCRFGDPETQVNLPLLDTESGSSLYDIMNACIDGNLDKVNVKNYNDRCSVCVCIVSGGYPGSYEKGKEIKGLDNIENDTLVFHAGTKLGENNKIITNSGRVLGITTTGNYLRSTINRVYREVDKIKFGDGFGPESGKYFYRKDIGYKALK